MNSKLIGGILLIIGTTIGAGILALPVATAQLGFWGSLILLVTSWMIMTTCAFLFLEVNLWLPPNTNLISMAGATLGRGGQVIAWLAYLLLLYSILSAYIAGGGDLFHYVLKTSGIDIPLKISSLIFTVLFGVVVYLGIRAVDYVNRGLMFGKMSAFILLVLMIIPFISMQNLGSGEFKNIVSPTSITVTIVAFTCAMIIPSLRTYFNGDVKMLRKAILIGTLIPLICYIAWDMVIMGVIPLEGNPGLKQILHSSSTNSDLVAALTSLLQKDTVTMLAKFFTSICMATSFLSISLSLSDFLSDGFSVNKKGVGNLFIYGATFLPPIVAVTFFPDAFIRGLNYAGISCFILMMLLPPLMVWSGRYYRDLVTAEGSQYQVGGGKLLLATIVIFSIIMIGFALRGVI
ncbi:MAG: Tryptophan/tyrosine permease [uncultured bacterium]|nr:MAG: Tryptophan/tyrosine permease [uncultured bacterium]